MREHESKLQVCCAEILNNRGIFRKVYLLESLDEPKANPLRKK